jgi:hypothetical protein
VGAGVEHSRLREQVREEEGGETGQHGRNERGGGEAGRVKGKVEGVKNWDKCGGGDSTQEISRQ